MTGRNDAEVIVPEDELTEEEAESTKLIVKYYNSSYEILEFSSNMKFDPSIERCCRKCKKVTEGVYVQVVDKIADICYADRDWISWPETKEKIMESPTLISRLNQLLKDRYMQECLHKFSRSGVCDNCLRKIDAYLEEQIQS